MAEEAGRTLVCSVLFIDIVAYSKKPVAEQFEVKHGFNGMLAGALEMLARRDRVIVDTGDGAAIVFLGDPEDALVIGVAMRGKAAHLPMRLGINLGPVKLMSDVNGQINVVGDGINVAQRIMSFAEPGQLLVSANYHDVVSRLSTQYARLFTREGRRQDKHVREYEVYSVSEELRLDGGTALTAETAPELDKTAAYSASTELQDAGAASALEPAKLLDAGQHLMISGSSRGSVKQAVDRLLSEGAVLVAPITMVGNKWIATCTHANADNAVKVEEFGLTRVISGTNRQAVEDKVAEVLAFGGKLMRPVELEDGVWTAVCDTLS